MGRGVTSVSLTRLCLCPGHDADENDEFSRPLCARPIDFVQQVGLLHGFMVTYLGIDGEAKSQVLTMTRFTISVDCGNGPNCRNDTAARLKVAYSRNLQKGKAWFVLATLFHTNV
eukprot:5898867-Amphidinium_carterae.1